jgi:hypothetical protein
VTIFYPERNAHDFKDLDSDPILKDILGSMCNTSPEVVGTIYHLPTYMRTSRPAILKHWKLEVMLAEINKQPLPPEPVFSLESMRELLQTRPYVFM